MYYFSYFNSIFWQCFNFQIFGVGKLLRQKIMSSFISSPTQNHFKFATWFHCITHIKLMNFIIFCILDVLSLFFYLEKCGLGKCKVFWLNHVSYEVHVLIRITSNLLYWLIVSYLSICRWSEFDIYFILLHLWVLSQ